MYFLVCILKSLLTPSFPGFLPQFGIMTHMVTCYSILVHNVSLQCWWWNPGCYACEASSLPRTRMPGLLCALRKCMCSSMFFGDSIWCIDRVQFPKPLAQVSSGLCCEFWSLCAFHSCLVIVLQPHLFWWWQVILFSNDSSPSEKVSEPLS